MSDHSEPQPMTPAAFDEALLRYGSDLAKWPEVERGPAMALLAADDQARRLLAEEQAMTGALSEALSVEVRAANLAAAVSQSVSDRRQRRRFARWFNPLPIAVGATAAVAFGIALGLMFQPPGLDPDTLLVTALGGGGLI